MIYDKGYIKKTEYPRLTRISEIKTIELLESLKKEMRRCIKTQNIKKIEKFG